jgi:hypothetical protein
MTPIAAARIPELGFDAFETAVFRKVAVSFPINPLS